MNFMFNIFGHFFLNRIQPKLRRLLRPQQQQRRHTRPDNDVQDRLIVPSDPQRYRHRNERLDDRENGNLASTRSLVRRGPMK